MGRGGLEPPASAVIGPERCACESRATERKAGCYVVWLNEARGWVEVVIADEKPLR